MATTEPVSTEPSVLIPNAWAVLTKAYSTYASGTAILALVAKTGTEFLGIAPYLSGFIPDWAILAVLIVGLISRFIPQASVTNPEAAPLIPPVVPAA